MHGRILQVSSIPSEHPFGRLSDCKDRLHELPIGEGPSFFMHVLLY